ncbi:hypothetical protein CSKR_103888 [Clonorchis sinensis]|uniref:Uncharacterized protein n=1 Tax=Clonorchis sinensis TaxID=79923 RepID=A0A419PQS8_CLOSI|nr:hypothetical protein CSKR_103888 [Clonorchis sinensis]
MHVAANTVRSLCVIRKPLQIKRFHVPQRFRKINAGKKSVDTATLMPWAAVGPVLHEFDLPSIWLAPKLYPSKIGTTPDIPFATNTHTSTSCIALCFMPPISGSCAFDAEAGSSQKIPSLPEGSSSLATLSTEQLCGRLIDSSQGWVDAVVMLRVLIMAPCWWKAANQYRIMGRCSRCYCESSALELECRQLTYDNRITALSSELKQSCNKWSDRFNKICVSDSVEYPMSHGSKKEEALPELIGCTMDPDRALYKLRESFSNTRSELSLPSSGTAEFPSGLGYMALQLQDTNYFTQAGPNHRAKLPRARNNSDALPIMTMTNYFNPKLIRRQLTQLHGDPRLFNEDRPNFTDEMQHVKSEVSSHSKLVLPDKSRNVNSVDGPVNKHPVNGTPCSMEKEMRNRAQCDISVKTVRNFVSNCGNHEDRYGAVQKPNPRPVKRQFYVHTNHHTRCGITRSQKKSEPVHQNRDNDGGYLLFLEMRLDWGFEHYTVLAVVRNWSQLNAATLADWGPHNSGELLDVLDLNIVLRPKLNTGHTKRGKLRAHFA